MDEERQIITTLKSILFLTIAPGTVVLLVPYLIVTLGGSETSSYSAVRYLAILLWLVGGVSILWCFKDFVVRGKGTPAPNDPPKELVAQGLYRYVRNPMYLSLVALLTGHLVWFQSRWLLVYASFVFLACHIFVTLYEEPNLTRKFGEPYQDYLHAVPRWLPRMTK